MSRKLSIDMNVKDQKTLVADIITMITDKNYVLNCDTSHLSQVNKIFQGYIRDDPSGSGLYLPFLYELTKKLKPELVVELGNREGVSTCMLYAGLEKGNLITVDIKKNLSMVPEHIKNASNVRFIWGGSTEPKTIEGIKEKSIDLLFIDTNHKSEHLREELALFEPLLKDNAILLLDDIEFDAMKAGWTEILHEKENRAILHGSGFGIVYFAREKESA